MINEGDTVYIVIRKEILKPPHKITESICTKSGEIYIKTKATDRFSLKIGRDVFINRKDAENRAKIILTNRIKSLESLKSKLKDAKNSIEEN